MNFLVKLVSDTEVEVAEDKRQMPVAELKRKIRDTEKPRSFYSAISKGFGIIAEIKRKSPSVGVFPQHNVDAAPQVYNKSHVVKAVSVLTNRTHFGMDFKSLERIKAQIDKPVLRKDFIFDEYQVYQARAYGADAILLMANVLSKSKMKALSQLAGELDLDVLFESHTKDEIKKLPSSAKICGLNSRKLASSNSLRYLAARWIQKTGWFKDLSTQTPVFNLVKELPHKSVRVAESGITPNTIADIRDHGFDAALIGTALLKGGDVSVMLSQFENALSEHKRSSIREPSLAHSS